MSVYKEMYLKLFNAVTDAVCLLDEARMLREQNILESRLEKAIIDLRKAQQKTEEIYMGD